MPYIRFAPFICSIAFAALVGAPNAYAEERGESSFYGSISIGGSFASDSEFSGSIGGASQTVETEKETGFTVGGALGRAWGSVGNVGVRTELEVSYRENDIDQVFFSGNGPAAEVNVGGDSASTSVFGNLLVDLPLTGIPLTPFAGFGVGVAFTEQDFAYGPGVAVGDSDEVFTGQFIAGVSYDISDTYSLTLDGRYQRAFGVESRRLAPDGSVTGTIEDDLDSVSGTLGLRVKF
jgi:hypothetical protein